MKLVSFLHDGQRHIGAVVDDAIVAAGSGLPNDMIAFLAAGQPAREALQSLIDSAAPRIPLSEVRLMAPIPRPGKFLGIGLNYADHISETGRDKPEYPTFFTKQSSCVIGIDQAIHCPALSDKVRSEEHTSELQSQR